ncbi:transposase [Pseudovibrio japonicus]|uniref:Transposase n=1 Tax=Pseudovibrio japonicus TaxID=366534 RepID=A0ABQ3ELY3_9HYPH|nr:transposase [Pseudovibrio japonicus]GHB46085.1 transposase [Pseudovibrio japonicus]
MQIETNSTWKIYDLDGIEAGHYRVLAIQPETDLVVLFKLEHESSTKLHRPIGALLSDFTAAVDSNAIQAEAFETPPYLLVDEESLPQHRRQMRDERLLHIQPLIKNRSFLQDFALSLRSTHVSDRAKEIGIDVRTLYRLLNTYWRYGQTANALLPRFAKQGAPGKQRQSGEKKRGKPVTSRTGLINMNPGINITPHDKKLILKGAKKFLLIGEHRSYKSAWEKTIAHYYSKEVLAAEQEERFPNVPNYRQFCYWVKVLIDEDKLIRGRTNTGDYLRNKRGLHGAATDHAKVPGSCFEIDATVADVHLVAHFDRSKVLGRPTIYSVVDVASRMIVGIHVSLEHASWRAAKQALLNAFSPKPPYCLRYGITITEEAWPCHHLPESLLCDRGELAGLVPEQLLVPVTQLSITPPYRPDMKAIVERCFGKFNSELLHELPGSTKGRARTRGEPDARLQSQLTIHEFTALLIDEVLQQNQSVCEALASQSPLLIQNGLAPTPLNYWNIHRQTNRTAFMVTDPDRLTAELLHPVEVSMTGRGIRLHDSIYYTYDHPDFDALKAKARTQGRIKLEGRQDPENASLLYVRLQPNGPFLLCTLSSKSAIFANMHSADISFFLDYQKANKRFGTVSSKKIESLRLRKQTQTKAQAATKEASVGTRKADKTKGMRETRQQALEFERRKPNQPEATRAPNESMHASDPHNLKSTISLLKRKKNRNGSC